MKKDLSRLMNFFLLFRRHWPSYCISTTMVSCRNLFITWITAYISSRIVAVVSGGGVPHLQTELVFFLSILTLFVLFDCIGILAQSVSIQKISNLLRERLYHSFLYASIPEIERNIERNELISRANRDVDIAGGLLSYGLVSLCMYIVSGFGATLIIGRESIWICVCIYVLGLIGLLLQNMLAKYLRAEHSRIQKVTTNALSIYVQTVSQSSDIRMANLKTTVHDAFSKCMDMFRRHSRQSSTVSGFSKGIDAFIRFAGFVGTVGLCLYRYANHNMTIAAVVLISQMAQLILDMILTISSSITTVHASLVGIDRIFEMLELPTEDLSGKEFRQDTDKNVPLVQAQNAVCTFNNGISAFRSLNINIPSGCIVALSGESGCGKSTLMRILLKIYPYGPGSIRILGQDVQECSADSIRSQVGYVPQQNMIFSGTLKDNLLMGNRNSIVQEEINDVLQGIGADSWCNALPNGLDTTISEGGNNLSGGQRQMLAIARALLCKYRILIMDEAFDGIDSNHIARIINYIQKSDFPKSVVIITHDQQVASLCNCRITMK